MNEWLYEMRNEWLDACSYLQRRSENITRFIDQRAWLLQLKSKALSLAISAGICLFSFSREQIGLPRRRSMSTLLLKFLLPYSGILRLQGLESRNMGSGLKMIPSDSMGLNLELNLHGNVQWVSSPESILSIFST
jgi:hypothetical protein